MSGAQIEKPEAIRAAEPDTALPRHFGGQFLGDAAFLSVSA